MVLYCGNGRSACATLPLKPVKTAFEFAGRVTPTLDAYARSPGVTSFRFLLRIEGPSRSAPNGIAFTRWKFERSRVARWPV